MLVQLASMNVVVHVRLCWTRFKRRIKWSSPCLLPADQTCHIVAYVLKGPASLKDKQIRTEAFGKPLARLAIPASSLLTWHAKSKSWIKRVTLTLTQERFLKQAVKAPSTNTQRLAFFRPYLHHLDPAIQEIATKEWARAPYKALRVSSTLLDRTVIRKLLEKENPNALHYVLLGLCGNINDDKAFLKRALRSPKAFAAKLTAHLEMHGKPALSSLVTRYFKSSKHSADEVEAAITAIGVHGTDNTTISRDTAQEALKSLFHHQPKQAAHAAPFSSSGAIGLSPRNLKRSSQATPRSKRS